MNWLKHAFAIEPEGPAQPNEAERQLAEHLCQAVVRRGLTTPALLLLETFRPLNYLAAQSMHFLGPIAQAVFDAEGYRRLAGFLERRGAVDYLCRRLEELEAEA